MRLLIDTHCWLWLNAEPERFSGRTLALLERMDTERLLSVASVWEIAVKHAVGKLHLTEPPARYVPHRLTATGTVTLSIDDRHALRAGELPMHHRDPFDRLIIAQAQTEHVPILTVDPKFSPYGVEIVEP